MAWFWNGFVYHHHAEGQIAKQPGINTVHREAKDGKQLPIKNNLIPPERLKILLGKAVAYLLLLLNGQNGNSAFSSITAVFQKGFHSRPPTESGVLH